MCIRDSIWTARPERGAGYYLALFNTTNREKEVSFPLKEIGLKGPQPVRDLWGQAPIAPAEGIFRANLPPHGSGLWRVG